MGQLPKERLLPSPPFLHSALDLFGPIYVKDTVKRRVKCKTFGVIFNCFYSRAVYLDLLEGYSTMDFLSTFKRFVSIRGYPRMLYSDLGSQLCSASKEIKDVVHNFDKDKITSLLSDGGCEINWKFTKSADSPWQNGLSESLI